MVMGTTVASSVADSCCKVCWLSLGSSPVMASSLGAVVSNIGTSVGRILSLVLPLGSELWDLEYTSIQL